MILPCLTLSNIRYASTVKWSNRGKGVAPSPTFGLVAIEKRAFWSPTLLTYLYIYIYEVHTISFETFFVGTFLLIVHTWNSSPLPSNFLWLQCTCFTIPTPSGRPHGSPLVWACQWPSSQSLLSPQLSHNDSLWA